MSGTPGPDPAPVAPVRRLDLSPDQAEALVRRRLGSGHPWKGWLAFGLTLGVLFLGGWVYLGQACRCLYLGWNAARVDWNPLHNAWRGGTTSVDFSYALLGIEVRRGNESVPLLEVLPRLYGLESLDLSDADNVSDAHLVVLNRLADLRVLRLGQVPGGVRSQNLSRGDAAMAHLTGLSHLEELDLTGTQVTDAGLQAIAGLRELKILELEGTAVTDASVPVLVGLPALQSVSLEGTRMSSAGIAQLMKQRPEVQVFHPDVRGSGTLGAPEETTP